MTDKIDPKTPLPILPLRDIVVFPNMIVPLFVGRDRSVRALEEVMNNDKQIILVAQKDASKDEPDTSDVFRVGCVGNVLQLLKLPDGTVLGSTPPAPHRQGGDGRADAQPKAGCGE